MTVTGPTVVVPMLRTIRPNSNISNVLRWEGILIDPVGALLAVMVFEFILLQSQDHIIEPLGWLFMKIISTGVISGIFSGWILERCLNRGWIPEFLQNMATLGLVLLTFSIANSLAHESGLLAVTLMGIWLANSKNLHIEEILNFKENLTLLLISVLFIVLSAQIQLDQLSGQWWLAIGAYLIVQFLARPVGVFVSTLGSELNWRERFLVAWIGPRGIVAAAISALFALKLQSIGYAGAELLVPLTFSVIVGTVLIQSLTAKWIGQALGVTEPESNGFLLMGAYTLTIEIAKALQLNGARVLVTDTSYSRIQDARMAGLKTFYGNPVSEYADQHLNLVGIGKLLALSPRKDLNAIACLRFSSEFGRNNVYYLSTSTENKDPKKRLLTKDLSNQILFGEGITFRTLTKKLQEGFEIRTTGINETFTFLNYREKNPEAVILFYLTSSKEIVPCRDQQFTPSFQEYQIIAALPTSELNQLEQKEK